MRFQGTENYVAGDDLTLAVNAAITLERPLLIKGEPGTGKTVLAIEVAKALDAPLIEWHIKSTTKAHQGLYEYDAVGRLRDGQLGEESAKDIANYIKKGKLWEAFTSEKRPILLIDEIDKADIDFPNDLLRELDEQQFTIEEKGEEVKANHSPIVIVTSNDEKDLPDAFLRRCLFYYIQFPYPQLANIVKSHFPESNPKVIQAAVERFGELRQKMEKGKAGKKVSTSELLDWFAVLRQFPEDEVLEQLQGEIPFPEILLKKWEDHLRYLQQS